MSTINLSSIVSPDSLSIKGKDVIKNASKQLSARFYLTSPFTSVANNWTYFPTTFGLATDSPPNVNASISSNTDSTKIVGYTGLGNFLIYIPRAGKYNISFMATTNGLSSNVGGSIRLCSYSSPAWPATNQAAQSQGVGQSVSTLATNASSWLSLSPFLNFGQELGTCTFSGILNAGTLIAPLLYNGGNTFNVTGCYINVNCDYCLA